MATDDLVILADVKSYIGTDTEDDTRTAMLITAASRWANKFTSKKLASRSYASEDEDTLYDGDGTNYIMLRNTPVTAIASVHESFDRTYDSTTLVPADEYIFYPDTGKLVFTKAVPAAGYQTIKVLYTAGYVVSSTVPEDLENAMFQLIDYWDKAYRDHRWGIGSTGVDDKRIVYEKGVPAQIKEALMHYRKVVLA